MSNGSGPNRTVFRPSPLQGLNTPQGPGPGPGPDAAPAPQGGYAPPPSRDDVPPAPGQVGWRNPMMAEAAPLLALLASVRSGRAKIALPDLHGRATAAIGAFADRMRGRYPDEHVKRAQYALCCTADDVALNLPDQQADAAEWARRSMAVRFFGEAIGGDRFWLLLDEMIARPAEFSDVLELYHACMAAGFEGRYRVMPDGKRAEHEVMQRAYLALQHPRALSMTELAPQWRGEPTERGRVGFWAPLALAAGIAAVSLVAIYIVLRLVLAQTGAPAMTGLAAINPDEPLRVSRVAPVAVAPTSSQAERIRTFLAPEIAQGLVEVDEDAATVRVRTTVGQLFRPGSDQLEPERLPLFRRIAEAIETEPGPVRVEGFTDSDRPSARVSFPDNVALSQARAQTAAGLIGQALSDPSRITAEGFGEAQPVASNDTAQGKAANRRVEVVVQRRG